MTALKEKTVNNAQCNSDRIPRATSSRVWVPSGSWWARRGEGDERVFCCGQSTDFPDLKVPLYTRRGVGEAWKDPG